MNFSMSILYSFTENVDEYSTLSIQNGQTMTDKTNKFLLLYMDSIIFVMSLENLQL